MLCASRSSSPLAGRFTRSTEKSEKLNFRDSIGLFMVFFFRYILSRRTCTMRDGRMHG